MTQWLVGVSSGIGRLISAGATGWARLLGEYQLSTANEAGTQCLVSTACTASRLWVIVASIVGTLTVRFRVNSTDGTQVLSITTSGTFEDTTHTDAVAAGNLLALQLVLSGGHSDTVTTRGGGVLLDDADANTPVYGAFVVSGQLANLTRYYAMGGVATGTTESAVGVRLQVATTLSHLRAYATTNGNTAASTLTSLVNGAVGGQAVSFAAGQTGQQEDSTGSDSVSAGQRVAYRFITGATGTSLQLTMLTVQGAGEGRLLLTTGSASLGASDTRYYPLEGGLADNQTTENMQIKARTTGTLRNFTSLTATNTRSDATTADLRMNATSSALGVSIGAGVTGIVEDLADTVSMGATDLLNYRSVTGAGTGTIALVALGVEQAGVAAAPTGKARPPSRAALRWYRRAA